MRSSRRKKKTQVPRWGYVLVEPLESRRLLSTYPLTSVPQLDSNPGAPAKLYLDFLGAPATTWGSYSVPTTPAYDTDGDPTTFNDTELANIRQIWARVAEKYSPFNIDIITVDPGTYPDKVAYKSIIGGSGSWTGGTYGGVTYTGSFYNGSQNWNYIFPANLGGGDPHYTAECVAHEAGHAFGLQHQSSYDSNGNLLATYYQGNSLIAPIMGNSYYAARGIWWYGTSSSSTTYQDDMAILSGSNDGFGYRSDGIGNSIATATALTVSGPSVSGSGIIAKTTQRDYWSFTTDAGTITLNGNVAQYGPTLDLKLELWTSTGTLVATADSSSLGETLTATVAAGSYRLVVASHGSYGDVGQYTVSGTIIPPGSGNPAPVANAGGPYTVTEGGSIVLSGAASTGTNLTYTWDLNGNGILGETGGAATNGDETGATPTFQPGTLHGSTTVTLRVTDGSGQTSTTTATINITNVAPTAMISLAPTSSPEGSNIILSGSATDPGPGDTFTYAWSVTKSGTAYTSGTGSAWSFTPNDNGTYVVTLSVTDRDGGVGTTSKTITVTNVAPTASINGAPASSPEGTTINLTSTVSDPGTLDTFTYAWSVTKNGIIYTSGTGSSFSFTPNDNAAYVVSLIVTDKDGGSGSDSKSITVTNVAPTAAITGAPSSSPEGALIHLTSSVIDPGTVDTFSYAWSVTKNGLAYVNGAAADLSFTPNDNGTYVVSLTVTDKDGGIGIASSKTINVTNVAPTPSIGGAPASSAEGSAINLTGNATDPGSLDTFTFAWSIARNGVAYSTGTGGNFNLTPNDSGTFVVTLTATDKDGGVGTTSATINVTNLAPTAIMSGAPATGLEGTAINLTSSATDPGSANTFTYAWSITRNGIAFASGSGASFSFTPARKGTYTVTLTATDDGGATGTAAASISVNNVAPIATINVISSTGTIALASSVTDPGPGDSFTYAWSVTKNGTAFGSGTNSSFSYTPDGPGTYQTTLSVTDLDGGVGTATQAITVNAYDRVISGTAADELYYLRLDPAGANVELYAGTSAKAPLMFSAPAADLHSLTVNSGTGNDQLIVDLANGNPIPAAGLFFSATSGSLQVIGTGAGSASYAPSNTTTGAGTLTIGSAPISFSGVDSIAISALANLSLVTTNSSDTILIDSPSAGVSRITGSSDAASIAPMQFSRIGSLMLDLGSGADNVTFQNLTTNVQIISGADVSISAGGTSLLTLTGSASLTSLALNDSSRLTLPVNGTSVLRTKGLAIGADGTLDLNDNMLIVQSSADRSIADLNAVQALLASGRNSGAWNGHGIVSSQAASETQKLKGLAAILDKKNDGTPLYTTFGGQVVDADCILVKYTWNGDMNLDGTVNYDDYAQINTGFLSAGADPGYGNGDLNYDGKVNFDDYFMINSAMLDQSSAPLLSQPQAAVAVPVQTRLRGHVQTRQHNLHQKRVGVLPRTVRVFKLEQPAQRP